MRLMPDTKGSNSSEIYSPGLSALLGVSLIIGGILVVLLFRFIIIDFTTISLFFGILMLGVFWTISPAASFRGFVDQMIKAEIPLRAGSTVTEAWIHPPVRPLLKVVTNEYNKLTQQNKQINKGQTNKQPSH